MIAEEVLTEEEIELQKVLDAIPNSVYQEAWDDLCTEGRFSLLNPKFTCPLRYIDTEHDGYCEWDLTCEWDLSCEWNLTCAKNLASPPGC